MSEESFKIYSGKRCEEYYKKYNLVSAVHKIIDLENIIKEVRELLRNDYFEDGSFENEYKVFELLNSVEEKV